MSNAYEISFTQIKPAQEQLKTVLESIQKEMKNLDTIRTNTFSDSVWKGPQKSKYVKSMINYQEALQKLYNSANDHLVKLNEVVTILANAETK